MRRILALALAGAALMAAGCGGPSEQTKYVQAVNKAQADFGNRMASAASQPAGTDTLTQMAGALDRLAVSFDAIKPPKGFEGTHGALRNEARGVASLLRREVAAHQLNFDQQLALMQSQIRQTVAEINREVS